MKTPSHMLRVLLGHLRKKGLLNKYTQDQVENLTDKLIMCSENEKATADAAWAVGQFAKKGLLNMYTKQQIQNLTAALFQFLEMDASNLNPPLTNDSISNTSKDIVSFMVFNMNVHGFFISGHAEYRSRVLKRVEQIMKAVDKPMRLNLSK